MNFDFKNTSLGEKLVLISACIAILSLFMPWASLFGLSQNGFQQQGYILLIAFLYPVITILTGKQINYITGIISGVVGVIFMFIYMNSKHADLLGTSINATGTGAYIGLVATVILIVGSFMCKMSHAE